MSIYLHKVKSRWQPGANTLAYFPFTNDVLDHSGNGVTLTNTQYLSKQSLGYNFVASQGVSSTWTMINFTNQNAKFISMWVKVNSSSGNTVLGQLERFGSVGYAPSHYDNTNLNNKFYIFTNSSYSVGATLNGLTFNEWHHITIGYDGSKVVVSKDGVQETLYNGSGYNFGNQVVLCGIGSRGNANYILSECIVEDKARTAEEVEDYYMLTKGDYYTETSWEPNGHTLSYFPLKSNADDVIGSRGLTLSGVTVSDGTANVSAATSYMLLSNTIGGTNMTASLWYYPTAFNSSNWNTIFARNGGTYHHLLISGGNSDEGTVGRVGFWNNAWTGSSAILSINKWYNIIITKSGTNEKIYVNGELVLDSNSSFDNAAYQLGVIANHTNSSPSQGAQGKISEVIFEDKEWSADEALSYYYQTRNDYVDDPWYPVKEYEVQNIYIGEYLNLQLVFDFSVDTTYGDYTYGYTSGGGLTIETSNGWVTDGGSSYGNGSVYKTIPGGAKKVWTRIQFNFLNTSTSSTRGGGICLYPFSSSIAYGSNIAVQTAKELSIADADVQKNVVNPVFSLGIDYYLDFKFDNGVFDAILTDMNNNVVSSTTYTNTSVTSIPTVGFSMWNHANTPKFCRIKKFWAAYES